MDLTVHSESSIHVTEMGSSWLTPEVITTGTGPLACSPWLSWIKYQVTKKWGCTVSSPSNVIKFKFRVNCTVQDSEVEWSVINYLPRCSYHLLYYQYGPVWSYMVLFTPTKWDNSPALPGPLIFQVLLSERPEYNVKIRAGFLLAPAAFMAHSTSNMFKVIFTGYLHQLNLTRVPYFHISLKAFLVL